jgi:uncharacterized protein
MLSVQEIFIYPVKSCAAMRLEQAAIEPLGLANDRRWMLVARASGKFITGRERGELVLLRATPTAAGLRLNAPALAGAPLDIVANLSSARRTVQIWGDEVDAQLADAESNLALSRWLGQDVELVHFDQHSQRRLDPAFAQPDDQTAFADGFPLLLISQASLDGLNARVASALPMSRFRPNLVIAGAELAHAEDQWRRIQIGAAIFDVVKPCTRCVFTTVDAETGKRDPTAEPLNTLKSYRRSAEGIVFGMNLIARSPGSTIKRGDVVTLLA